ncbi:uncharacterized protein [Lolium perenne]|uniref:uncharacterized protein n=1 Tax=Lolium perenne TaxID=4522 RepID=UPI0021F532A7|nr:uncharacterized protein LOC127293020 [Lolium perenne]
MDPAKRFDFFDGSGGGDRSGDRRSGGGDRRSVRRLLDDAEAFGSTAALVAAQTEAGESALYVAAEAGALEVVRLLLPLACSRRRRRRDRSASPPPATADANVAGPEYDLSEPTMAEKLAALNLPTDDVDGAADEEDQAAAAATVVPPSADSVHVLLRQALRADDRAALLGCLCNRDDKD